MRQLNTFVNRYRSQQRCFTEAQTLKFTKSHEEDTLRSLVLATPNSFPKTALIDVPATAEPARRHPLAKEASA